MKKIFTILLTLSFAITCFGQGKLINSSTKSAPKWLNREVDQYEIIKVSSTSTISLDDAKNNAYNQLKDKVTSATVRYMMNNSINPDLNTITTNVKNSQYIKSISESLALDYYWEVRKIRKNDQMVYNYYFLYNFNDFEMKKIALEINKANSSTLKEVNKL